MAIDNKSQPSKYNRKRSKKIVFDDELVTKDSATRLANDLGSTSKSAGFKREDKKLTKDITEEIKGNDVDNASKPSKRSKTKKTKFSKTNSNEEADCESLKKELEGEAGQEGSDTSEFEKEIKSEILKTDNQPVQKEESKRARKRRRHMELLQTKKIRSELNLQEKCLNYLSLWKHSRTQWKFEKLKQIWLQQNMFDDVKIPDEFWDTLVEYFNSAKGHAKASILSEATKIVDSVSDVDKEGAERTSAKYSRARNIIQNLQE